MEFKVGDMVKVKSLQWYESNNPSYMGVHIRGSATFYFYMKKYCGRIFEVMDVHNYHPDGIQRIHFADIKDEFTPDFLEKVEVPTIFIEGRWYELGQGRVLYEKDQLVEAVKYFDSQVGHFTDEQKITKIRDEVSELEGAIKYKTLSDDKGFVDKADKSIVMNARMC